MDNDNLKLRRHMQILILKVLEQKTPPADDAESKAKYLDVARRLEQQLFKMSMSKEEYVNESTLEYRLASVIKGRQLNSSNQGHANPSSMSTSSACASVGLGPSHNTVVPMDHDISKVREYMRTLVFSELDKRQPCPADDASKAKYLEVVRRLEEGLFKIANTKEDYLDQSTLDSRLATLISGRKLNTQQNANSSPPGTMTTLAPQVSPMVGEKVPESEDELAREIAENLKSMSLYG